VTIAGIAARKLLVAVVTVVSVSIVVFWALNVLPQDVAISALGPDSTQVQRAAFRERMHLDQPAVHQYLHWIGGMLHGDFGTSVINGLPVGPELLRRLAFTTLLAILSLVLSTLLALVLAFMSARRQAGVVDTGISMLSIGIAGLPEFVVAIAVLYVGGVWLRILPISSQDFGAGSLSGLVMPTLTLTIIAAAYVVRHARVSVIETQRAPHVRTATLRGYSSRRVLWRHVMPVAGIVVVNVVALNAIYLVGGVIVVENVFSYPGLGQLLVQSLFSNDYTKVEGIAVVFAALVVGINLVADGTILALDPRLRARRG
jgi:peptide/nickel transport system permease protein